MQEKLNKSLDVIVLFSLPDVDLIKQYQGGQISWNLYCSILHSRYLPFFKAGARSGWFIRGRIPV